jgi:hypothetical protein
MTPPYPKHLIEVDLPIKPISAHARREKSIRHGHISTLRMWRGAAAARRRPRGDLRRALAGASGRTLPSSFSRQSPRRNACLDAARTAAFAQRRKSKALRESPAEPRSFRRFENSRNVEASQETLIGQTSGKFGMWRGSEPPNLPFHGPCPHHDHGNFPPTLTSFPRPTPTSAPNPRPGSRQFSPPRTRISPTNTNVRHDHVFCVPPSSFILPPLSFPQPPSPRPYSRGLSSTRKIK